MLEINQIQELLPHRFPFLLIDRVIELEPEKKVVALKNVTVNEWFFAGHFPGRPIMPGVLVIEAMAQAAVMLFYSQENIALAKKVSFYLGSVRARFFNPVLPGDQLKITVKPIKLLSTAAIVNASAEVGDKEIAKAELTLSIKKAPAL